MAWYVDPDPRFQPAMRIISSVTNSNPAVITTSIDHDYESDLIVRILIPSLFNMTQLDKQKGTITVLSDNTFSVDIDTTNYNSFLVPTSPTYYNFNAQVIPIGNITSKTGLALKNVS